MGQGSSGFYDDEEDYSQGDQLPMSSEDRASDSLREPSFQLPRQDDTVAAEAERAPEDDSAPTPQTTSSAGRAPGSIQGGTPEVAQAIGALGEQAPTPQADQAMQGIPSQAPEAEPLPQASTRAIASGRAAVAQQMWQRQNEANQQAYAQWRDQYYKSAQKSDAQAQKDYDSRQNDLHAYLDSQGVMTEPTPEGGRRVVTDEQGNVQWKPVSSKPFQQDDGQWVRRVRDSSGAVRDVSLMDSGDYTIDQRTGALISHDGAGGKIQLGYDQPTVQRIQVKAQRGALAAANAADELALSQIRTDAKPLVDQYKQMSNMALTSADGTPMGTVGKAMRQLQLMQIDPNAVAGKSEEDMKDLQDSLSKWQAAHPEFQALSSLHDSTQDEIRSRQQAIIDRKNLSLALANAPLGTSIADLLPASYQDTATQGQAPQSTSHDHAVMLAGAAAAKSGTAPLQELTMAYQRLKADGVKFAGGSPIDDAIAKAQAAAKMQKASSDPVPKDDGGWMSRIIDGGARIVNGFLGPIQRDLEEAGKVLSPISEAAGMNEPGFNMQKINPVLGVPLWLGSNAVKGFFKDNADYFEHQQNNTFTKTNAKYNGSIPAIIAETIGGIASTIPADAAAALLAPLGIAAGAAGIAAKAKRIAVGAIPIATHFAASDAARAIDDAAAQGQTPQQQTKAGWVAAGKTVEQLPAYMFAGAAAGKIEKALLSPTVSPLLKGATSFLLHGTGNAVASAAVRGLEGENIIPTSQNLAQDFAWGAYTAITHGMDQASKLATLAQAKKVVAGEDPQHQALVKMGQDEMVPDDKRLQARQMADTMRDNAVKVMAEMKQSPGPAAATEPTPATPATIDDYKSGLSNLANIRTKMDSARADGDSAAAAQLVQDHATQTAKLGEMAQRNIDAIPTEQRTTLGKAISPDFDPVVADQRLRNEPDMAFAAQELGAIVSKTYRDPAREKLVQSTINQSPDPNAAAKLADRYTGMIAAKDLRTIVEGGSIPEERANALYGVGLLDKVPDGNGGVKLAANTDAHPFLPAVMRQQLEQGSAQSNQAPGTPKALFSKLSAGGRNRALEMFHETPQPEAKPHVVDTTVAPKASPTDDQRAQVFWQGANAAAKSRWIGETVNGKLDWDQLTDEQKTKAKNALGLKPVTQTALPITVTAKSQTEALAKATAKAQSAGHTVHEASVREYEPATLKDFTLGGRQTAVDVHRVFMRNKPLFEALGVTEPTFVKWNGDHFGLAANPGRRGQLLIDGDKLRESKKYLGMKGEEAALNALQEEVVHLASIKGAEMAGENFTKFYSDLFNDPKLDPKLVEAARQAYGDSFDGLSDANKGAEIVRMVVQQRWTGTITERIYKAIEHIVNYLKGIKIEGGSELLKRAIEQTEGALNHATETVGATRGLHTRFETAGPGPEASAQRAEERGANEPGSRGGEPEGSGAIASGSWDADNAGGEETSSVTPGSEEERALALDAMKKEEDALKEAKKPRAKKSAPPKESTPPADSDKAFADSVMAAAKTVPESGWFGPNKVFMGRVWDEWRKTPGNDLTLDQFKAKALSQLRKGNLGFARADFPDAHTKEDLAKSHMQYGPEEYHFLHVDQPRALGAAPVVTHPNGEEREVEPRTEGPHVMHTVLDEGEGRYLAGDRWNAPHQEGNDSIFMQHLENVSGLGKSAFAVQDENGNRRVTTDRNEAARIAEAAGQRKPGTSGPLQSQDLQEPRALAAAPVNLEEEKNKGFYSQLERKIQDKIPNRATPEQIMGTLGFTSEGEPKGGGAGVKKDELLSMGLPQWLKGKQSVTKQELQDFVRANTVQLREHQKSTGSAWTVNDGSTTESYSSEEEANRAAAAARKDFHKIAKEDGKYDFKVEEDDTGDGFYLKTPEGDSEYFDTEDEADARREELLEEARQETDSSVSVEPSEKDDTEFSKWKTPGGENYKETVYTLPTTEGTTAFKSSHWDEPNVLFHTRQQDFKDTDGNKVRLIEEIQSDWMQAKRKQDAHNMHVPGSKHDVPIGPFQRNWHELAFKYALRDAVNDGADKIAWVTGEQAADRFDISKSVDRVTYNPNTKTLRAYKDGESVIDQNNVEPEKLPDYLGKEVSTRLMSPEHTINGAVTMHELRGEDLKVGSPGMVGFYDKIIPDFVRKYVKPWGAQVEDTTLANGTTVHAVPITPKMRESIATEGQPLFAAPVRGYADEAKRVLDAKSAPKERVPSDDETARIERAYRDTVAEDPNQFPAQRIADVMERAGYRANDPDAKSTLMGLWKQGKIVSLGAGDWSLADDRTRAWGVPGTPNGTALTMRMADETKPEYFIQHRPNPNGAPAYDLTQHSGDNSVYEHPEWYTGQEGKSHNETVSALKSIRGKPDAKVTVFRAAPKNALNEGDWVSLSKTYAKQHGMADDSSSDVPVHSFRVSAKDLKWPGDELGEFGYFPESRSIGAAPVRSGDEEGELAHTARAVREGVVASRMKDAIAKASDATRNLASLDANAIGNRLRMDSNHIVRPDGIIVSNPDATRDREAASAIVESGKNLAELQRQRMLVATAPDPKVTARYLPIWDHAVANFDRIANSPLVHNYDALMNAHADENDARGIDYQRRENYVSHRYKQELNPDLPAMIGKQGNASQSRYFLKQRSFESLADAIHANYKPASVDLAALAEHRIKTGNELMNVKAFIDEFKGVNDKTDGKPIIGELEPQTNSAGKTTRIAPEGYSIANVGGYQVPVHQQYEGLFRALFGPSAIRQSTAGRVALKLTQGIKHKMLAIDTFHAMNVMYRTFFATGKIDPYFKPNPLVQYRTQDLNDAVAKGEITKEQADYARSRAGDFRRLVKNGLNVGRVDDPVYAKTPGPIYTPSGFTHWVFQKLTRGAMADVSLKFYDRNKKMMPGATEDEVASKTATEVNRMFGSLGNQGVFKSKTFQDISRLIFFAPQWMEGTLASELQGYAQLAKLPADLVMKRRLAIGNVARMMAAGTAAAFAANQIINMATRGKPTWENDEDGHKLDAFIGGGKNGFFFSPFSMTSKFTEAAQRYYENSHPGDSLNDKADAMVNAIEQIGSNKLSAPFRAGRAVLTGKDYYGRPLGGFAERATEGLFSMAPIPILAGPLLKRNPGELPSVTLGGSKPGALKKQLFGSMGIHLINAQSPEQQMYALAHPLRPDKGTSEIAPGQYTRLRDALDSGDRDKSRDEILRLVDNGTSPKAIDSALGFHPNGWHAPRFTGADNTTEAKFTEALTPKDKAVYAQAIRDARARAMLYRQVKAQAQAEIAARSKAKTQQRTANTKQKLQQIATRG